MPAEGVAAAAVGGAPQIIPGETAKLLLGRIAAIGLEQPQDLVRVAAVPCLLGQADLRDVHSLLTLLLRLLLGCLVAAELVLRGEIGLRPWSGPGVGSARPDRSANLASRARCAANASASVTFRWAAVRRSSICLAVLQGRLGQVLVRGEIDHQGHDHGDRRHQGRRKPDQAGPMVIVGMQAGAAHRPDLDRPGPRVRGRIRRRPPQPAVARLFAGLTGPLPLRAACRHGSHCAGDGPARRDTIAGPRWRDGRAQFTSSIVGITASIDVVGVIVIGCEFGMVRARSPHLFIVFIVGVIVRPIVAPAWRDAAGDRRRGDARFPHPRRRPTSARRLRLTRVRCSWCSCSPRDSASA